MSELREALEALRQAVSCDRLTGLANRRALFDAARVEMERCTRQGLPFSLLMCDADHFRSVNDRYGHAVGDVTETHHLEQVVGVRGVAWV